MAREDRPIPAVVGDPLDSIPAEIAEGVYLPFTRYRGEAYIEGTKIKVTFTIRIRDREPVCESLTVESRDGTAVSASTLRAVPVAGLIRFSLTMFTPYTIDGSDRVPLSAQSGSDTFDSQRGRRSKEQTLAAVVEAYRRALANPATAGRATQTVADELHYRRGHVSRLLSEARSTDPPMLGPARRGRSGERA